MGIIINGDLACNLNGKLIVNPLLLELPQELKTLFSKIRVQVKPWNGEPYYMIPLADEQSKLLEVEVNPDDWCHEMCQLGMEDRGLPYDNRGHGEMAFRVWWGKSPNHESYDGELWFLECWAGGGYPKIVEYFYNNIWSPLFTYGGGGSGTEWAWYREIHPDGHIM